MNCLLDTTIVVDLLNDYLPALQWRNAYPNFQPGITSVTWLEIVYGSCNRDEQNQALKMMSRFSMVYVTQSDQDWAMEQFAIYRLSHNVDVPDALIAAPSHRLQLPLYTRNLKHFAPLLGKLAQEPYT
jgi:predicted nucleic acid-binding protein